MNTLSTIFFLPVWARLSFRIIFCLFGFLYDCPDALSQALGPQELTQQQALQIADQLYERKMLNKAGKKALLRQIKSPSSALYSLDHLAMFGQAEPDSIDLNKLLVSRVSIIAFCLQAFVLEYEYRFGFRKLLRLTEAKQQKQAVKMEKDFQAVLKKFNYDSSAANQYWINHRMPKAARIEFKIVAEDSIIQEGRSSFGASKQSRHYIDNSRSVWGKTRTRTARDLFETGLIDARVYEDVRKALADTLLPFEENVCHHAMQQSIYYYTYSSLKAQQVALLDSLYQTGIFTHEHYQQLLNSYKPYELKSNKELLSLAQKAQVIDLRELNQDPRALYPQLFERIRQIIPEFIYKDLQVKLVQSQEADMIEQTIMLSFKVDTITYTHAFIDGHVDSTGKKILDEPWAQVGWDFHQGINRYLADKGADYRLFFARSLEQTYPLRYPSESPYIGLILLTEQQRQAWGDEGLFLSDESFDRRFTSENVEKLVDGYEQLGLFSHLSPSELEEGRKKLASHTFYGYADVLMVFPHVIHAFDWETGNLENPYQEHTQAFSRISRGAFTPQNIEDNFAQAEPKGKKIHYGFTFNGKSYQAELENNGDWLDTAFYDLIQKALAENKVEGKFYYCWDNGQEGGYIFLTPSQYEQLKSSQPDLLLE